MGKRKQIPKGVRFDVFKRDGFKCQYCGRTAPDVILEVDHIVPVSEGGENDPLNLITSCRDCNRGKGKKQLTNMTQIERQRKQLDDLNEIREQTEMLVAWKRELLELKERQIDAVEDVIVSITGFGLSDSGRQGVSKLISRFGFSSVFSAAEIAFGRYDDWEYAFSKIGGICYNRAKEADANAE